MSTESRRRTRIVDLSRPGGAVRVEIDASEAADVLLSACGVTAPEEDFDSYEVGGDWIRELRASLDPGLLEGMSAVAGTSAKLLTRLLGVVDELPPPRSFASFLARLEELDPLELELVVLGYYVRGYHAALPSDDILAATRGDVAARARVLEVTTEWPDAGRAAETVLDRGGEWLKERLLELLPRWYDEVFARVAAEALPALEQDAAAKRELIRDRSPEEAVELVTSGVQYTAPRDVRKIVLFPTYWLRPWVLFTDHKDVRIFCYSVGEPVVPADVPGPAQLARIFKALGDEGRLKLLKRLSEGPMGLADAAGLLGVAKSTAHHHMAVLRQAGFVFVRDEDENMYSLRSDLLPQAGALLDAYLRR